MSDPIYLNLSRYTQPVLIILGTLGGLFNQILLYKRKSLRTASCSLYFRALSINDILVLYVYVFNQWLIDQYNIDPTKNSNWYCKLKNYINSSLYTVSPYLIVLACFDRLCTSSTNVRLRRLASLRVASFLIPATILFVFLIFFHILIGYELVATPFSPICTIINPTYSRIYPMFLILVLGLLPPSLMLTFCTITLFFLRRQRRRVMPVNQFRARQRDNQLIKMLSMYVVSHSICTLPFTVIYIIYAYQIGPSSATMIVLLQSSILLFNVNFSTSFYVYTLGTPFYRRELYSLLSSTKNSLYKMWGIEIHRARIQTPILH